VINVTKIGHLALETSDVERLVAYYTDVLDFDVVERGPGREAYLATDLEHHCVVVQPAGSARLAHLAFQVAGPLDDAAAELERLGIEVERRSDPQPGIPAALRIHDPEGNPLDLYSEVAARPRQRPATVRPQKLGHVCYFVADIQEAVAFYTDVLGFRWSDWMGDFFVFLRCSADHHTINLLKSDANRRLHHIGYELRDWAHIQLACDTLGRSPHPLVWGPGRHGPGHNLFTYHRDPDGHVVELFAELDLMVSEELGYFEPRPWHADAPQRPKVWTPGPRVPNSWGPLPPDGFLA
jgi:catechol 2,3-dioxygenase-like lactoylglutathione lyase family enzyme